jgi:hypothetical protein
MRELLVRLGSVWPGSLIAVRSFVAMAAVAALTALAGCSSVSSGLGPQPAATVAPSHRVIARSDGRHSATLDVVSGATTVTVTAQRVPGTLVVASTPSTSSQIPVLGRSGSGAIDVQLTSVGGSGGPAALDVAVSPDVTWTIELDGGASSETVDLRSGRASLVDLVAGVTHAVVDLPAQSGTTTVHEVGGASELQVSAPRATASRVEVDGGASSVRVGSVTHTGVGAHRVFTDARYPTAPDRVNVVLQGGVSSVVVGVVPGSPA